MDGKKKSNCSNTAKNIFYETQKLVKIFQAFFGRRCSFTFPQKSLTRSKMNRLGEKVKDIVEVRASSNLKDFLSDPFATVEGYHFTDITSDLMSKWLDRAANAKRGSGEAMALAGFRGVGKSHFLAVLGALMAQPDCRARIADGHVSATAQQLSRRPAAVAHVKRGSEKTLIDELKTALAEATHTKSGELGGTIDELLMRASARSLDLPLTIIIDTDSDRESRVTRDDGPVLSQMAEDARKYGVFLGLALDDDIAGADGMNSSIASSFSIDYLDQEHLYKIVNAYVFAKRDQMRPLLHEIYESYRTAYPAFRWSEHRFLSLYPLHPAILEIAPFIRLYLQDFALLGFASEAGLKILGRPANSLIGLDEVFDGVETRLRAEPALSEALRTFDLIDRNVIAQMPVMKRLAAKLLLKGLFLLSLKEEGVTVDELNSTMLISGDGTADVEAVLESFATQQPEALIRTEGTDGVQRFSFRLSEKDELRTALSEGVGKVSSEAIHQTLQRQLYEKFADIQALETESEFFAECRLVWRGGIRRGAVRWAGDNGDKPSAYDLTVYVGTAEELSAIGPDDDKVFRWVLADLTAAELETIGRFNQLHTDPDIREQYRDSLASAIHAHSIAVDSLWQRVCFEDASITHGGKSYTFSAEAVSAHTLSELFSIMLRPAFEKLYPQHPDFGRTLEESDALFVTKQLFGGDPASGPDVEACIAEIALPLGLVKDVEGTLVPVTEDEFSDLPIVSEAVTAADDSVDTIPLSTLDARLGATPFGLTSEAQHLLLSALVAQRHFEFVTSAGNRIHYRSLDLHIDWHDIVGIARPAIQEYSNERLVSWAAKLTGDQSLSSGKTGETRSEVIGALAQWLTNWKCNAVIARFDELPDESLNSTFWRQMAGVRKSFGAVADYIEELIGERGSLDNCLQNIADTFGDSERDFETKLKDLAVLEETLNMLPELVRVRNYVLQAENTGVPAVDAMRTELVDELAFVGPQASGTAPKVLEKAKLFSDNFAAAYTAKHDAGVDANTMRERLDEFLGSDLWTLFSSLSVLPVFDSEDMVQAMHAIRSIRNAVCSADVGKVLETQPVCSCGYSMSRGPDAGILISKLSTIVANSLKRVMQLLIANSAILGGSVGNDVMNAFDDSVHGRGAVPVLSGADIRRLKIATEGLAVSDRNLVFESHHFESLSDVLLENELGRLESSRSVV